MSQILNILHLSDLHFTKRNAHDQAVVLDALKEDLRKECDGPLAPDAIVLSGDLVNAADEPDIYGHLYDTVIEPIVKITKCSERRIFMCPGNHDAQRNVITARVHHQTGVAANITSREAMTEEYRSRAQEEFIAAKFENFFCLRDIFQDPSNAKLNNGFVSVYSVDELNLDIVSINTAWLSWAGLQGKEDLRKLPFPEAAIAEALRYTKPDHMRVLIGHHPTNWLDENSETDFHRSIGGSFALHLFGHMHEPNPIQATTLRGQCLQNQSGALFQGRRRYNGYSFISTARDNGHSAVTFRSYFDTTRRFDAGIDVVPSGVFYPNPAAHHFWTTRTPPVDMVRLRAWLTEEAVPAAVKEYDEGLTDRKLCEVFVPPPLFLRTLSEEKDKDDTPIQETEITLDTAIGTLKNVVLHGREEYGKTTLLQQIAVRLLRDAAASARPTVPVMFDFTELRQGQKPVHRALRQGMITEPSFCTLTQLLQEGLVTVMVDNVDFGDRVRMDMLRTFITENPRNRFIFSTLTRVEQRFGAVATIESAVAFDHVHIRELRRAGLRSLVEKWDRKGRLDRERTLERLLGEMVQINVPVTAINGTILLAIFEDKANFRPVNRSVLMENFIETLLEKRAPESAERRTLDFHNKVDYLSSLAAYMARQNRYVLSEQELEQLTREYFDHIGLSQNATSWISQFTTARLLACKSDGMISFHYRAYLEYFIAARMDLDHEFRDWVLEEERYLSFINEIQYYAGKVRNARHLLDTIGARFEVMTEEMLAEVNWEPDLKLLAAYKPPHPKADGIPVDDLTRQIHAPPLTQKERDEVLDTEIPRDAEDRQEVFRPTLTDPGWRWSTCLFLYSGVLKNLETIPDTVKREHFSSILKGWGIFTMHSFMAVPLLAKHRRMRINGVWHEVLLPRSLNESQLARAICMQLPVAMSRLITGTLGTEKLERQIREPRLEEANEPLIAAFYRHMLAIDLRLGEWLKSSENFVRQLEQKSEYFLESAMLKLSEVYRFEANDRETEAELRRIITAGLAQLRGQSAVDRARDMQRMQQDSLVRRLRLNARKEDA